jgi:hypothetical protein
MLTLPPTWFSHDSAKAREAFGFPYVTVPNWDISHIRTADGPAAGIADLSFHSVITP